MLKLSSTIILSTIFFNSEAQIDILGKKRTYKIEGYIFSGIDTINGIISIPIRNDELNYSSLATVVEFTDSLNHTRIYRPKNTSGFGLRGDAVFGDYVSISLPESPDSYLFLKRVLTGTITLYEKNLDGALMGTTPNTRNDNLYRKQRTVDESIYYLQMNNEALITIELDPQTSSVKRKDLKKLINILPDVFTNSEEEINVSELIKILSDYNLRNRKE